MKFSEIPYKRPVMEEYEADYTKLLTQFKEANSFEEQDATLSQINKKRDDFETMYQLAYIRYTTDTTNETLKDEANYFDEVNPLYDKMKNQTYEALINAKYKNELETKWGQHIFDLAALKVKAFDPQIIGDLQEENRLKSEYTKLKGMAKIEFEGKTHNLPGLMPFMQTKDRSIRKKASEAYWGYFAQKQEELDDIFDKLVKVRHNMAVKMGYKNYVDLGYVNMERLDYTKEMVQNLRQQIVEHVVPITQTLRARQKKRLGVDNLYYYDFYFDFKSGNPKPKGTPQEILAKAQKMYGELSKETAEFFDYMLKYDLLDVINRPGKADAGYCWCLSNYKHPFIFANFNGTSGDIDVLTHEAGHAFQYFCSSQSGILEYREPSSESCEIHAMSMEVLTYPWMHTFFEEDVEKYFFAHLSRGILFYPYGCAVDHVQHLFYENPHFTPQERADAWKEMERLYLPDYQYDKNAYLESGRYWQRQGHFFEDPFYYIDYVLAGVCAYQFWQKSNKDKGEAWKDYHTLCKAGGTAPFLELLKIANLKSPFEGDCVERIAKDIAAYLEGIDDTKF